MYKLQNMQSLSRPSEMEFTKSLDNSRGTSRRRDQTQYKLSAMKKIQAKKGYRLLLQEKLKNSKIVCYFHFVIH